MNVRNGEEGKGRGGEEENLRNPTTCIWWGMILLGSPPGGARGWSFLESPPWRGRGGLIFIASLQGEELNTVNFL
jgi:hypothetical protein